MHACMLLVVNMYAYVYIIIIHSSILSTYFHMCMYTSTYISMYIGIFAHTFTQGWLHT